nr:MAG: terminase large subunit [Caudoviricetes sp.]
MTTVSEKPKTVDEYLDEVDYSDLDSYVPGSFALMFIQFIKLVNNGVGDSHKTPVVHMKMLDKIPGGNNIANLCSRGMAKTTLMFEYLVLFLAVFGEIPGFGRVEGMIYVSDSMENGVKSARKNIEFRYKNSAFLQEWIPHAHFTDNFMEFTNKNGQSLGVKMFGAKTGLRGTKINGKRPTLAVLDDLVSDDDARSKVSMQSIKDTVYKGVDYALDPTNRKIIFNGTPFNKGDILYEAVESGGWEVNVWPICERFPCSREEFRGAWPDRFSYDYVKAQYDKSVKTGQVHAFLQELMLRIQSDDDRIIQEGDIRWYDREALWRNRFKFNWYVTSDLATSQKESGDDAAISVWAHSANGGWFWYDGIAVPQTLDKSMDQLFVYAQKYSPLGTGIEVNGQQGGFIAYLQQLMMDRNNFFTLTSANNGGHPGIRSTTSKFTRFMTVVPLFKNGMIHYPNQMKFDPVVQKHLEQLRLVRSDGFKARHDDCLDTISQLQLLNAWRPASESGMPGPEDDPFAEDADPLPSRLASYIV